ncbi:hypothetical protein PT279_02630 [Bifidobacterium sp. ESL0784]|nr:hypothetical protein [Bifidobacterium sp. ESL0784]MDF7640488.1 hypothetical protein [Bifidobacterium sp. ESL0784]
MFDKGIETGVMAIAVRRSLIARAIGIFASTRRSYSSSTVVCSDISD